MNYHDSLCCTDNYEIEYGFDDDKIIKQDNHEHQQGRKIIKKIEAIMFRYFVQKKVKYKDQYQRN